VGQAPPPPELESHKYFGKQKINNKTKMGTRKPGKQNEHPNKTSMYKDKTQQETLEFKYTLANKTHLGTIK